MAEPIRMCIGCRGRSPQAELIRLVARGTDVAIDVPGTAPGRGAYLHAQAGCVQLAVRRRTVSRALRVPVDAGRLPELMAPVLPQIASE